MKRLSAVAVAVVLCLGVSSSFASFDYFTVAEQGTGEVKFGLAGDEGLEFKIRYSPMEKLEIFSALGGATESSTSNYTIGARYQIIDMLAGFVNFDLPTIASSNTNHEFTLVPGVNFTTSFADKFTLGSVLQLGMQFTDPLVMDLTVGVELDYAVNDNISAWVGVDFVYADMTGEGLGNKNNKGDRELKMDKENALRPVLGVTFSGDHVYVGTKLGLRLDHEKKGKSALGGIGGVEFGVKF